MTTYLVAVYLIIEADNNYRAEIADALHDILTGNMRKYAGEHSALVDWAIAGEDIASSITPVDLPADYAADESRFPVWPERRSARPGRLREVIS